MLHVAPQQLLYHKVYSIRGRKKKDKGLKYKVIRWKLQMLSGRRLADDQSGPASIGHNGKRLSVARIFIAWRSWAPDVAREAEAGGICSATGALWERLLLVSDPVAHGESKRLCLTSWLAWWQGGSRAPGIFSSLRWSSLSVSGIDMLLKKDQKRLFHFKMMGLKI